MGLDPAAAGQVVAGALGALVGLVLALTGAGGGVLAVPLLVLVLHWPLNLAAPTGLMAVGLAAASGALVGLKQGEVRWRAALLMGGTGMLGAPVGVKLAQALPAVPLLWGFALLMLWLGWRQWPREAVVAADQVKRPAQPCQLDAGSGRLNWTSRCAQTLAFTGLLSGTLSGLVGVGGGFVIVPALQHHSNLALRQVQLTSLAVIALVALSGVATAAWHDTLPWASALPFAAGAMLAMGLGRMLAGHLPTPLIQRLFALSCVLTSGLLLWRTAS